MKKKMYLFFAAGMVCAGFLAAGCGKGSGVQPSLPPVDVTPTEQGSAEPGGVPGEREDGKAGQQT